MEEKVILQRAHQTDVTKIKEFTDRWIGQDYFSLDEIESILEKSEQAGESASFLAKVEDELAGVRLSFAPGAWIDQNTRGLSPELWNVPALDVAYFKSLFVAEKFQKMGIGKKLSTASIEVLKKMGAKAILCHSWLESPGNSSQRYLQSMGFVPVKEHKKFWYPIDYICTRCGPQRCVCTAIEMIKYLE